ncbi:MAG TPA: hypothetical protein ENI61_04080 [Ignavibacteria bacterium]|nr:hypothetical protein [Ignavibacteria bacterium]
MENKIKLGDKVRDKISGFTGIVVAKSEFLNGCIQCDIMPKCKTKDKMPEAQGIDIQSLEVIKNKPKKIKKSSTGGRTRVGIKQRGF